MSEQFRVSVIVPFYNAKPHIKTCLEVLLKQDNEDRSNKK